MAPADPGPRVRPLADDHARLRGAARRAGAAVLKLFEAESAKSWTKADRTPVSEADLLANDILKEGLLDAGDGYGWLSEESAEDPSRLEARRTWIVDPVDGTRAFLKGRPHFAVCAALIEEGDALASVIFNPATDEFFEAVRGGGATLNGRPIGASDTAALQGCRMLGQEAMFRHKGWPEPWPEMNIGYRNSTSYRLALVACGAFDAAIALSRKADWDVAPGALIASEAGARVSDHKGAGFRFGAKTPVQRGLVCAAPSLYPRMIERLAHLPDDLRRLSVKSAARDQKP